MNYDHDCPFEAYITNLGKYNEGKLVGEWVKFPTTYEDLQKVFERIGIGPQYEEWFITDYDCYVEGLHDVLGEYESLDELNYLANSIENMDRHDFMRFEAVIPVSDYSRSVKDLINLTENLDKYEVYSDVHDHDDLGRMYIEEYGAMEVPDHLKNYIDYEAYGRDIAMDEIGHFTDQGYIRDTGDSFSEVYDGSREDIPEEYRVMSRPDDGELTQDDKLDMATDLAFDLDEFFRQKDPQYAAEHPDTHSSKEQIADMLLKGKIRALKEQLAELAQEPDDVLPSRIAEYEAATGYEEHLDIDTAALRERVEDTFSIYQLKDDEGLRDYRFESLDNLQRFGLSVKPENYDLIYTAPLTEKDDLESIYARFNINRPENFHGHSLSVSDVVVLHQDGKDTAHFCDSFGFTEVPRFLEPTLVPDNFLTGERIETPRGGFRVANMTKEQMEAAGYGYHHSSDDGRYHIMGNGTRAFAIRTEPARSELDNPLRTAEMTLEDDYGMIDGIINNGRRGEELDKAKEAAEKAAPDKKSSIMERLEGAKQECAERKPSEKAAPHKKQPERGDL